MYEVGFGETLVAKTPLYEVSMLWKEGFWGFTSCIDCEECQTHCVSIFRDQVWDRNGALIVWWLE